MTSAIFNRFAIAAIPQNVVDATPSLHNTVNQFLRATTLEEKKKWLTKLVLETEDEKFLSEIKTLLDAALAEQNLRTNTKIK